MRRKNLGLGVRMLLAWFALAICFCAARAQEQDVEQIAAKQRFAPEIQNGLRAMKLGVDGNFYVLTAPGAAVSVLDAKGKLLRKIPDYAPGSGPQNKALHAIVYGEDMDVDAAGTVYVADRGGNSIKIWQTDGSARMITVRDPVSVAALPDGEVAVSTLRAPRLIQVYGKNGNEAREFGDPEEISDREDLNRFLNIGVILTDARNRIYYGFAYMPEPTVRTYDIYGYAGPEIQYAETEAAPEALAVRREIKHQEEKGKAPTFKRVMTGFGVDRTTGEVWMALQHNLLHFDKEGNRRESYQLYSTDNARLEANTILVLPDELLIGSDRLGIFSFERPDKKTP